MSATSLHDRLQPDWYRQKIREVQAEMDRLERKLAVGDRLDSDVLQRSVQHHECA